MENYMTANVDKTPEQIKAEMVETRESLTEKVSALENQVIGTVQNAATTITDTVDAVKSFVTTAPETVSETFEQVSSAVRERVEKTFDISSHVRSNPWSSVGVSVGLGFVAGLMAFRGGNGTSAKPSSDPEKASARSMIPPPVASPRERGVLDDILELLGRKAKELTETAIDSATRAVNQSIQAGVPKLVEEASRRLVHESRDPTEDGFDAGNRIYGR
jgi:ElaB/YqjD/DUF883 family membrane-anchored ribosome-binding protein